MYEMSVRTLDGQSLVATLRSAADGDAQVVAISNTQGEELAVVTTAQLWRVSRFLPLSSPGTNPPGRVPGQPAGRVPARVPGRVTGRVTGELGPIEVARLKTFVMDPARYSQDLRRAS